MKLIPLGTGACSSFGGPDDAGIKPSEGLALVSLSDMGDLWFQRLFGTINTRYGAGRNLNPKAFYCAMAWAYGTGDGLPNNGPILPGYSREDIRRMVFAVQANNLTTFVQAVDWGPDRRLNRLIDLSPAALGAIKGDTGTLVTVTAIVP